MYITKHINNSTSTEFDKLILYANVSLKFPLTQINNHVLLQPPSTSNQPSHNLKNHISQPPIAPEISHCPKLTRHRSFFSPYAKSPPPPPPPPPLSHSHSNFSSRSPRLPHALVCCQRERAARTTLFCGTRVCALGSFIACCICSRNAKARARTQTTKMQSEERERASFRESSLFIYRVCIGLLSTTLSPFRRETPVFSAAPRASFVSVSLFFASFERGEEEEEKIGFRVVSAFLRV